MSTLLNRFIEDMAACGYDRQDTINRAHSIAIVAMWEKLASLREKSSGCRREFREALGRMDFNELQLLIKEIEQLEGGEL